MTIWLKVFILILSFGPVASFVAQNQRQHDSINLMTLHHSSRATVTRMPATTTTISNELHSALKKPSKTLAVSLEYTASSPMTTSTLDLMALSMQLRKLKASAIWTSSIQDAKEFVQEQTSARGDFPGPCPIVYTGSDLEGAVDAGVNGIVVSAREHQQADDDTGLVTTLQDKGIEIIWKVDTVEDVVSLVESMHANAFLVNSSNEHGVQDVITAIPSGSVIVASVQAMQDDNAELETGKELKTLGCTCIFVKQACIGDGEDVEYATFVVDGLTRRKSRSFNMTGLTGSTNGHFGGVATTGATTWLRTKR